MVPLVLSLALSQPPTPAEPECRLLARGDGYFVHAVPVRAQVPGQDVRRAAWAVLLGGPRYAVLHTDTKTGAMRKLIEGGVWVEPHQPMALNRTTEHTLSIAAAATGPDRLYVLAMRAATLVEGEGLGGRREPRVSHVLYVFRLADGSTVQEVVLPEPRERLAGFNRDSLDPDLVRVAPDRVRVGAVEYRIGVRLERVELKE